MIDKLAFFIAGLRWQDILDITLNSYILFRFYILFRGTYVFRVLIGLGVLWFFQQVAVSMGLIVTSWVFQGILAVAAFIIIVVFRNEISTVLQAKNLKSLLWGLAYKTEKTPIESISAAVFEMARRKCGALIVFPGRQALKERTLGSLPWKGVISREMILSIFYPDNPVHDGAAIVRGNQVTEVGAILPLSRRHDLPSHYGTRHRAALGLSESTDAVVIVVSEERGDVVLAKGSHLREIKNRAKLEQKLREHMGVAAGRGQYRRRQKLEVLAAALVSLIFISGLWYSVSKGLETLATLQVPVEYMNRDPGIEILNASSNSVSLDLSGSGALIKSIRPDQVQVKVDLGKAVAGHNAFTITRQNISLPPGVVLKRIYPTVIDVSLDVTSKKKIPVQVDWVGKLAQNLIMARADVQPDHVQVIGGKRILEKIDTIYTAKVPLDNLKKGTGKITANLALHPASLKIAGGTKVTISYQIKERQ